VGTFAAGQTKYVAACAVCHSAGSFDPSGPFQNLAGKGNLLVSNLGTISSGMNGVTLTGQEILDLKAFLAAVK
jgi:mono/diheme cytochrome c family protein